MVASAGLLWLIRLWRRRSAPETETSIPFKASEQGLSEVEAAERHTDDRLQARLQFEKQARLKRRRRIIFSILSLTILVLSISQVIMKDYLGSLATLGTLVLNIVVNIFQEERSARKVGELAAKARPMAAVIREGSIKSIDQDDIVVGDILVAGKGDEILTNGVLVEANNLTIEESSLYENIGIVKKEPGELLQAGSSCDSGWAVYRVEQINIENPSGHNGKPSSSSTQVKTPLQTILDRVLYLILFFAAIFYIVLMLGFLRTDILPADILMLYRDVMSIIFSIAPGGLFLMIVINYAVGSADIARSDALVKDSFSIESLAQVTTLCLIRHGGITGLSVDVEMIPSQSGNQTLSASRARQALGNYVHSIQGDQFPLNILKQELEGERRNFDQLSRHLSIFGWEAATFTSSDMPGTYVIGYSGVLEPNFKEPLPALEGTDTTEKDQGPQNKISGRLRKLFRRKKDGSQTATESMISEAPKPAEPITNQPDASDHENSENITQHGLRQQLKSRLVNLVHRKKPEINQEEQPAEDENKEILRLIFAYSPQAQRIYDADQQPHCPEDLIPVCYIKFEEQVRPEIKEVIRTFVDAGVSIKTLADDEPMRTLAIARQLGLVTDETDSAPFVVGEDISQYNQSQLKDAVRKKSIFSLLSTEQSIQIIDALQQQDEYVAVVGSSIKDLPIMRQANLSITRQGSNPTVLNLANIILLKNTPNALPEVFQKGQRIVNGMLDVLKLNLTQIIYILLLLGVMFFMREPIFFYHPSQGGAIAVFTVVLPGVVLSIWSSAVAVRQKLMPLQLLHFIIPAAMVNALCVVILHTIFLRQNASIAYTQLAVTHLLVTTGLMLVVFVQPPLRFLAVGDEYSGDWRPTYVAGVLFVIFQVANHVYLAQYYLKIGPLASAQDYFLVSGISLVWAILVFIIWRLRWLTRIIDWSQKLKTSSQALGGKLTNQSSVF